jgi:hypothetical protein
VRSYTARDAPGVTASENQLCRASVYVSREGKFK